MPAQDPDTERMEGRDPDAFGAEADHFVDTLPHLSRSLVGKGDGQNVPGADLAFLHQVGDPVGDDAGLAAAGSGQYQNRPLCLKDSLLLFPVQCIIYTHPNSCSIKPCSPHSRVRRSAFPRRASSYRSQHSSDRSGRNSGGPPLPFPRAPEKTCRRWRSSPRSPP